MTGPRSEGSFSPIGWYTRPPAVLLTSSEAKCLKKIPNVLLAKSIRVVGSKSASLLLLAMASMEYDMKSVFRPGPRKLKMPSERSSGAE